MKFLPTARWTWLFLALGLTSFTLLAAELKSADPLQLEPADPHAVQFHLMDGAIVSGKLQMKELEVETDFGLLKIPVDSIRGFAPGLKSHAVARQKIKALIEKLGETEAEKREPAIEALLRLGPGVRAEVDRVVKAGGAEFQKKLKTGLDELDTELEQLEQDDSAEVPLALTEGDSVETPTFTAVGRIVPQTFVLASPYGDLKVKLSDIRRAKREVAEKSEIRKSIKVDGVNLVQHDFVDSGIRVQKGDKISVNADGTVVMTPWGTEAKSTPDGAANYDWYVPEKIPGGALVAKIGSGEVIKVGAKHTYVAERSGMLRFAIAISEQYADQVFPGNYNVRIRVQPK